MVFEEEEINFCLAKAKEFAGYYAEHSRSGDGPIRSVDELRSVCEIRLRMRIRFLELLHIDGRVSSILAAIVIFPGGFDICYARDLNYCWRRFLTCKELFQGILDDPKHWNMNLDAHVAEFTVSFPDPQSAPSSGVRTELLAEFAAMEFLFPFKARKAELFGALAGNFPAIAEKYKIPQVLVEKYLSTEYMESLGPFSID